MKVILRSDVPNLGAAGEPHDVSAGYFRNFLQPRGLAVEATSGLMKTQQVKVSHASVKESREVEQTRHLAGELGEVTLSFPVKIGDQGRMYGSITTKDIADELKNVKNVDIDRHKIVLNESLRSAGEHSVTVKLDHGVEATLKLNLVPETSET